MYRRYYQSDELISNVIVTLIASLLLGFMISWKLVGVDTFDAEMIVYISMGGLLFVTFIVTLVLFFVGNRKPLIDVEIDFESKTITTHNRILKYSFEDIKLYSYNKRHHQVRLFIKNRLFGFPIEEVTNRKQGALTEEQALKLSEHAIVVQPKQLYNYALFVSLIWVGLTIFYVMYFGKNQLPIIGNLYIPTYYAFVFVVVMIGSTIFTHNLILKRFVNKHRATQDTSDN